MALDAAPEGEPVRAGSLVGRRWLDLMREPGARLVLRGRPVARIWRPEPDGWREIWAGPAAVAVEAIRAGLAELEAYGGGIAVYRITRLGHQALAGWTAERDRLLSRVRALEAQVAELRARTPVDVTDAPQPIEGLAPQQSRLVREIARFPRGASTERLAALLGDCVDRADNQVRVQICRIRALRPDLRIETVRGWGYRLLATPTAPCRREHLFEFSRRRAAPAMRERGSVCGARARGNLSASGQLPAAGPRMRKRRDCAASCRGS